MENFTFFAVGFVLGGVGYALRTQIATALSNAFRPKTPPAAK